MLQSTRFLLVYVSVLRTCGSLCPTEVKCCDVLPLSCHLSCRGIGVPFQLTSSQFVCLCFCCPTRSDSERDQMSCVVLVMLLASTVWSACFDVSGLFFLPFVGFKQALSVLSHLHTICTKRVRAQLITFVLSSHHFDKHQIKLFFPFRLSKMSLCHVS